jgi:DNA repair protein RadC
MSYLIPKYQISLVRDGSLRAEAKRITASTDAAPIIRALIGDADREHFVVLCLDGKNAVIAANIVSVGSLNLAIVHPRETFKAAVLCNANAIICGHNHPSGDPEPSMEDQALTKRLHAAGEVLGIKLLDHIIIGDEGRQYSFADQGRLDH